MNDQTIKIAPMLSIRNGVEAVKFYMAAFGADEKFRVDGENGALVARLSVGGAGFWVADESPENSNFSPESLGGGSVRMEMTVNRELDVGLRSWSGLSTEFGAAALVLAAFPLHLVPVR